MPRKKRTSAQMAGEYARRSARARGRKFAGKGYAQERAAKVRIKKEYTHLMEKGIGVGPPAPGSTAQITMLEADAIIQGYSKKIRERADQKGESLLGRTKKGRAIRDKLRELLGYKDKKWSEYYPLMRALYRSRSK